MKKFKMKSLAAREGGQVLFASLQVYVLVQKTMKSICIIRTFCIFCFPLYNKYGIERLLLM